MLNTRFKPGIKVLENIHFQNKLALEGNPFCKLSTIFMKKQLQAPGTMPTT